MKKTNLKPLTVSTGCKNNRLVIPGTNRRRLHVPWYHDDAFCPIKNGNHNPKFITWLMGEVKRANNTGYIPQIVLLSYPLLIGEAWKKHALNSLNGGPISGSKGVDGVYNDPKTRLLIHQMARKINRDLPPGKYKFEWFFMWENFNKWKSGGREWAAEMVSYIKDTLRDPRPVGTGNAHLDHIAEIEKMTEHRVTCYVEALNYTSFKKLNWKWFLFGGFRKFRVQFCGFWESYVLRYKQKNPKLKEAHFRPGRELENIKSGIMQICLMIINGLNPSSVFDMTYSDGKKGFWASRGVTIPAGYDMKFHRRGIEGFFSYGPVGDAIEHPELMRKRAGRRALKRKAMEYVEGLKK